MFDPPSSGTKKKTSLAKVAAVLAVVAGISFGLCTVSAMNASSNQGVVNFAIFCGILVGVCILGLVIVGIFAVVNLFANNSDGNGKS